MRTGDLGLAGCIAAIQLTFSITLGAALSLLNPHTGLAALTGGLTGLLASGCFALIVLGSKKQQSAGRIVFDFYLAELVKLATVVACSILIFKHMPIVWNGLNVLALFGAYLLMQGAYILAPIIRR
jgi:F0F1-type ATP synthase assembly protein I